MTDLSRLIINEIKTLVSQKNLISGFWNGFTFTSTDGQTNLTGDQMIMTVNNPSSGFVAWFADQQKWLFVGSNNSVVRRNLITNRKWQSPTVVNSTWTPTLLWEIVASQQYGIINRGTYISESAESPSSFTLNTDGRSFSISFNETYDTVIENSDAPTTYAIGSGNFTYSRNYSSDNATYFQITDSASYNYDMGQYTFGYVNTGWSGEPLSFTTPVSAQVQVDVSFVPFSGLSQYPGDAGPSLSVQVTISGSATQNISINGSSYSGSFNVPAGGNFAINFAENGGSRCNYTTVQGPDGPEYYLTTQTTGIDISSSMTLTITVTTSVVQTQFLMQQGNNCNTVLAVDNFQLDLPFDGFDYTHYSLDGLSYVLVNRGLYVGSKSTTSIQTTEDRTTNSPVVYSYNNGTLTTYNSPATIPPTGTAWDSWIRSYFSDTSGLNYCTNEYKESDYNFSGNNVYWIDRNQNITIGSVTQSLLNWLKSGTTSTIKATANIQTCSATSNSCTLTGMKTQSINFTAPTFPISGAVPTLLGICLTPPTS